MKYIRIENKIIKLDFDFYDKKTKEFVKIHKKERFEECVFEGEYKHAKTIEELCDEFVIYNKHFGEKSRYIHKMCIDVPSEDRHEYVIYGAIWTEWGLKYVAKMNDKGELELL